MFCYPFFRVAVRGNATLKIACIGHSVLGEPQGTIYDIVFSLGRFYIHLNANFVTLIFADFKW